MLRTGLKTLQNSVAMLAGAFAGLAVTFGSAQAQIIAEPCETCGLPLGKALPEGFTFITNENYGERDGQNNRLNVDIPTLAWSTPYVFNNTRLEVFAIVPVFVHIDGAATNRGDFYASSLIAGGAHDFGNGLVFAGPRSDDAFLNVNRGPAVDFRASLVYDHDGYEAIATFIYSGNFGGVYRDGGLARYNDNAFIDYSLLKNIGKFQFGVVGTAVEDISGPYPVRPGSISVGGLVGYDFGVIQLQAYVTREVAIRGGGWGLGPSYGATNPYGGNPNGGEETRGFFRFVIPLYKNQAMQAPVVARY